jgi:hypothetical protein
MDKRWIAGLMAAGLLLEAGLDGESRADAGRRFIVRMAGTRQVRPAVPVRVAASFRFNRSFTALNYRLAIRRGVSVLGADLHCGPPGQAGPVVAGLLGSIQGGLSGTVEVRASLTAANFLGSTGCPDAAGLPLGRLADLAVAMGRGAVYLEIWSAAGPEGSIRRQVTAVARLASTHSRSPEDSLAQARAAMAQAVRSQTLAQAAAGLAAAARNGRQNTAPDPLAQGPPGAFDASAASGQRAAQTAALAITEAMAAQAAAGAATRAAEAAARIAERQDDARTALRLAAQAQVLATAALSEAQAARAAVQP